MKENLQDIWSKILTPTLAPVNWSRLEQCKGSLKASHQGRISTAQTYCKAAIRGPFASPSFGCRRGVMKWCAAEMLGTTALDNRAAQESCTNLPGPPRVL